MTTEYIEQNMISIKEKVKYLGLPELLSEDIKTKILEDPGSFFHVKKPFDIDQHTVMVSLGFERQDTNSHYNMGLMGLQLLPSKHNILDKNIFILLPGYEVTIREAFNLMRGRFVYRAAGNSEKEGYWLGLTQLKVNQRINTPDIKKSTLNIEKSLDSDVLERLIPEDQKNIIAASLKEGNRFPLRVRLNNRPRVAFLQANPEENQIDIRKDNRQLIDPKDIKPRLSRFRPYTIEMRGTLFR